MGSSSSKAARGVARKYPTRAPPAAVSQPAARSRAAPAPRGDGSKDEAVRADAMDPDAITPSFSSRLHQMGVAEPNPTWSPSSTADVSSMLSQQPTAPLAPQFAPSTSNTTLSVLENRSRLQELADREFEAGAERRRFVDVRGLVEAVRMREKGWADADIEDKLRLQEGVVSRLGNKKLVKHLATGTD